MAPESPSISTYLGMGAVIAATLVAGMALGWLVDSFLNTTPIFILVGLVLGVVVAGTYAYRAFRQFQRT